MPSHSPTTIPEDRPLTGAEQTFVRWLLEHGTVEGTQLLSQIDRARVVARCSCGCASVDFFIDGRTPSRKAGMKIVSDYRWDNDEGYFFGAFVFACEGLLAGLDLWSIDGRGVATSLPQVDQLRPIDT